MPNVQTPSYNRPGYFLALQITTDLFFKIRKFEQNSSHKIRVRCSADIIQNCLTLFNVADGPVVLHVGLFRVYIQHFDFLFSIHKT